MRDKRDKEKEGVFQRYPEGQEGSAQVQQLYHSDSVHVWFRKITCSIEKDQDTLVL